MWDGPTGEGLSRQHIMVAVEDSLRRLQTDYIDLYQTHAPDWDTPIDETLRALDDLVTAGKVRYIGASNHRAWLLMKALWTSERLNIARYECIQPHYHLLNRAEVEPELAAVCIDQQIAMIPYSPLAGGFLTGKYQRGADPTTGRGAPNGNDHDRMKKYKTHMGWATLDALRDLGKARDKSILQMALGWQLSLPWVTSPIIGANTVQQLDESLGALGLRLGDAEMARLDEVTHMTRNLGMENS
jgi:aryl-alcohol dehydrogenase-like predicted oxidoreductase